MSSCCAFPFSISIKRFLGRYFRFFLPYVFSRELFAFSQVSFLIFFTVTDMIFSCLFVIIFTGINKISCALLEAISDFFWGTFFYVQKAEIRKKTRVSFFFNAQKITHWFGWGNENSQVLNRKCTQRILVNFWANNCAILGDLKVREGRSRVGSHRSEGICRTKIGISASQYHRMFVVYGISG